MFAAYLLPFHLLGEEEGEMLERDGQKSDAEEHHLQGISELSIESHKIPDLLLLGLGYSVDEDGFGGNQT